MRSTLPTLFLLSVIWAAPVWANQANRLVDILVPDAGVIQRLTVTDGSQLYGQVESVEIDSVVFRSIAGLLLTVPRDEIADLRIVRGYLVEGEFLPQDSHNTRLMFAPTARSLRRGEGYFGVYYVLPFVQVGVTDRLSIGGGTPLVFGDDARPVWFTPKLQVLARENVQAALGVIHITGVDDLNAGVAYGVATLGPEDKAATIGLGYAYSGDNRSAILMVGGERRQSRRIKWITENWFWGGGGHGFVSGGVRFLGERLTADLSLLVPLVEETIALPVVSFSWSF